MTERFTRLSARFPRKRVFITGAGSGLGLELAKLLADDGWTLGLFDRNLERLTSVEAQFTEAGVKLIAYPGDVTQADELTVAVNSFAATHDGLDVMINNAGVAGGGSMMEVSLEDWRWIIDINVMGVVHGSRAAIPHLQRNGSGLLINVAQRGRLRIRAGHDLVQRDQGRGGIDQRNAGERVAAHRHASVRGDADVLSFFAIGNIARPRARAHCVRTKQCRDRNIRWNRRRAIC